MVVGLQQTLPKACVGHLDLHEPEPTLEWPKMAVVPLAERCPKLGWKRTQHTVTAALGCLNELNWVVA